MDFFDNLNPLLKVFWYVALPSSFIFIIQTILTFIGSDASDGVDADFDGNLEGDPAPFQLFSLRNLINFLLGFSWTGISFYKLIPNQFVLVLIALAVGSGFVYLFFVIIRQVQLLAEDNSFRLNSTLGKTAQVYLSIPGQKQGTGKVMLSVKGSVRELTAMTEHDRIETSSMVKITSIESDNILIVEKI